MYEDTPVCVAILGPGFGLGMRKTMGVIQLRPTGGGSERAALRLGVAVGAGPRARLRVLGTGGPALAWCAGCASPIEFGRVIREGQSFCSIECSLGGGRPA